MDHGTYPSQQDHSGRSHIVHPYRRTNIWHVQDKHVSTHHAIHTYYRLIKLQTPTHSTAIRLCRYNIIRGFLLLRPKTRESISSDRTYHHRRYRVSHLHRAPLTTRNVIAATTKTVAPRYTALFLLLGGIYGSFNVCNAWTGTLFARPRAKRALAYAIINGLANSESYPREP
jgi:hypothetical protein